MNLNVVVFGGVDCIHLAQDRDRCRALVSAVMNLRVPQNAGNFLTGCKPVSCSRRTVFRADSQRRPASKPCVPSLTGRSGRNML